MGPISAGGGRRGTRLVSCASGARGQLRHRFSTEKLATQGGVVDKRWPLSGAQAPGTRRGVPSHQVTSSVLHDGTAARCGQGEKEKKSLLERECGGGSTRRGLTINAGTNVLLREFPKTRPSSRGGGARRPEAEKMLGARRRGGGDSRAAVVWRRACVGVALPTTDQSDHVRGAA